MTSSLAAEREFAVNVVKRLREQGFHALWAGGCVRDLLLKIEPSDYDVATNATPEQVRILFGKRWTLPVGMAFGVVIVLDRGKAQQVEVATFRTDANYSDGRRPDHVTYSSPEEDAQRRDFTINGMFYDPIEDRVIDYVGGERDLREGLIRAIGDADARIAEDKLRMLRAVRFAARFGFAMDNQTKHAIERNASDVSIVSGERVAVELQKTLQTTRAAWAVSEWAELGLLDFVLPQLAQNWTDVGESCCAMLDAISTSAWQSKLGVLAYCAVDSPVDDHTARLQIVTELKTRLKLSNADTDALRFALRSQAALATAEQRPWSEIQPLVTDVHLPTALELLKARCARGVEPSSVLWILQQLDRAPEVLRPEPILVGEDLIALGLKPSPRFKDLLSEARKLQLDQVLSDRDSALQWAKSCSEKSAPEE